MLLKNNVFLLSSNFVAGLTVIALNRHTFKHFPWPLALTSVHYFFVWGGLTCLKYLDVYEAAPVPKGHTRTFYMLVATWSISSTYLSPYNLYSVHVLRSLVHAL